MCGVLLMATTEGNVEVTKIDEQLQKNRKREDRIERELKALVEDVGEDVHSVSNAYREQYKEESRKIKKLQMQIEKWEKKLKDADYVCENLKKKYQQEKIDISDYEQLKNNEAEIERNLEKNRDKITIILQSIEEERKNKYELKQKLQSYELNGLAIQEINNNLSANALYIDIKKKLEDKDLFDSNYSYLEMKSELEKYINQLVVQGSSIEAELNSYHTTNVESKDECLIQTNTCHKMISELQFEQDNYLQKCQKLVGTSDSEQLWTIINQINEQKQNRLRVIVERSKSETTILTGLNDLKEQKRWMDARQNLESNKLNLETLTKCIEKLQKSKNYVEDYIVNETNEYFNSDIINQIYNKIDPHPTMKHIKFITEKDGGGLKTRIYTYDESESNKMSPVVYLSSAQVNILSLCIFLSKVLSEKNTTFNTIFIDDPIQHLDGINLLSFIDVLRVITTELGRQVVISTHNEQFYKLLKVKMDERYYQSKFIELTSTGTIKKVNN